MNNRRGAPGRITVRVVTPWLALTIIVAACSSGRTQDHYRRESDVYSAVLRAAIGGVKAGGGKPLVFVSPLGDGRPFPLEVQAGVIGMLTKEADLKFVDQQSEAIDAGAEGQPVLNGGVLLSLGPVPPSGSVLQLSGERYHSLADRATLQFSVRSTAGTWLAQIVAATPGG